MRMCHPLNSSSAIFEFHHLVRPLPYAEAGCARAHARVSPSSLASAACSPRSKFEASLFVLGREPCYPVRARKPPYSICVVRICAYHTFFHDVANTPHGRPKAPSPFSSRSSAPS
jgi:hypothetical protein